MNKHLSTFLLSLCGGFLGAWLLQSIPAARAASSEGLWVTGPDGRDRVQIATYTAPGEKGLPLVGLFDNRSRLRLLLRLAGTNESPVVVMKDSAGRDRLVMGLGLNGNEDAFLYTSDSRGHKTSVFGQ